MFVVMKNPLLQHMAMIIRSLRLIFWGMLICIIDITLTVQSGRQGFRFDIINDVIGMIMITAGVVALRRLEVHTRYHRALTLVRDIGLVGCVYAVLEHFFYPPPDFMRVIASILGLLNLLAILIFTFSMGWLCRAAGLARSEGHWRVNCQLWIFFHLIPLGLHYMVSILGVAGHSWRSNFEWGGIVLLMIAILCVPLIHLFISTSRMDQEAKEL